MEHYWVLQIQLSATVNQPSRLHIHSSFSFHKLPNKRLLYHTIKKEVTVSMNSKLFLHVNWSFRMNIFEKEEMFTTKLYSEHRLDFSNYGISSNQKVYHFLEVRMFNYFITAKLFNLHINCLTWREQKLCVTTFTFS